jgi:hypothetical protein
VIPLTTKIADGGSAIVMDNADSSLNRRMIVPSLAIWAKRPHDDVFVLGLLRQRCVGAKAMHSVIDAVRSRRLNDPAYLAIAAAVATVVRQWRGYLYSEPVGSNSAVRALR